MLFFALLISFHCVIGVPIGPATGLQPLGKLHDSVKDTLLLHCQKLTGSCKSQRPEVLEKKRGIKEFLIKHGRHQADVDRAFAKTFEAKVALFNFHGLSDILPADDGTWAGDQLLSEQQAQSIIDALKLPSGLDLMPSGLRVKRGPALSFELYPTTRWSMPVPYHIDTTAYNTTETFQIMQALSTISSKTCVIFKKLQTKPTSGYYISYGKNGGWGCGNSYIGRQEGGNPISLSNGGTCKKVFYGAIIHETLHSLGLLHEQARYDRDKYIKIFWDNVDPQYYDLYVVANPNSYTPYGVKYDVMSVMHYPAFLDGGSINKTKPVLATIQNPSYYASRIGYMDTFTDNDVELIKRAYCRSSTCVDSNTGCGWHAANGLCSSNAAMMQQCARSCNSCS